MNSLILLVILLLKIIVNLTSSDE